MGIGIEIHHKGHKVHERIHVIRSFALERTVKHFPAVFLVVFLVACSPETIPLTPATTAPVSPTLTETPLPTATTHRVLTVTPDPSLPSTPTPLPTQTIGGLTIVSYEIKGSPALDPLYFVTVQGEGFTAFSFANQGPRFPDRSFFEDMHFSIWADLGSDRLIARENYNQTGSEGWVTVMRDGGEIYRISTGRGSPINALRGLWVYDDHWVLETAHVSETVKNNVATHDVRGQIVQDGVLLNDLHGYEEAFGFQTINGRPFYFFERDSLVHAWYDGQEIPLGYESVPHYGCCSAGELNPQMWQHMVAFFGTRGETWYYVKIGVFDQP